MMMRGEKSFEERVVSVKEILVYVCSGGRLHVGVDGRITYFGGSTICKWISQSMGIGEIWKVLEKEIGENMSGRKVDIL